MDDQEFKRQLAAVEIQITEIDHHIGSLQLALKDAKKQREEKIGELRGLARDDKRPIFKLIDGQEAADAH